MSKNERLSYLPALFAELLFTLLLTSCESKDPQPQLFGTEWRTTQVADPDGQLIYKELRFNGDVVQVDYRVESGDLYTAVGTFPYMVRDLDFWVHNPDNSLAPGLISDQEIQFGGETFHKQ